MLDYTINTASGKKILTILYSFCMIDNQISKSEEEKLKVFANNLLNITDIPRTHLVGIDLNNALASLNSSVEKMTLIGLMLDIAKGENKKNINTDKVKTWIQHACTVVQIPIYMQNKVNDILRKMSADWTV